MPVASEAKHATNLIDLPWDVHNGIEGCNISGLLGMLPLKLLGLSETSKIDPDADRHKLLAARRYSHKQPSIDMFSRVFQTIHASSESHVKLPNLTDHVQ